MALDATVGGPASNSYQTVAGADAYFADHLFASGWQSASTSRKEAALIMSTRSLDGMAGAWTGNPANPAVQALRWPRLAMRNRNEYPIASNVIPQELKNATSEYAGQLLISDPSAAGAAAAMGLTSVKIEGLQLQFQDNEVTAGETPAYLDDPSRTLNREVPASVIMLLVPSWLIDKRDLDAPHTGLVAEVL